MRLIDADELIINLYHNKKVVLNDDLVKCIDDTETAYEIDKVVAELDGAMWLTTNDDGETNNLSIQVVSFEDAIEIVKQGGVGKEVE